jgi:hypothetical protein
MKAGSRRSRLVAAVLLAALHAPLAVADAPSVEHQPVPCTVPGQPISLCASVTDDGQVAKARVYFRSAGEKFYSFVEMVFGGLSFCGTLPAPREGKLKTLEYYIWGVDDAFETQRTSTHQILVQPDGVCEFPPVEKDPAKAGAIVVYASNQKQGKKLSDAFLSAGVSFVPAGAK